MQNNTTKSVYNLPLLNQVELLTKTSSQHITSAIPGTPGEEVIRTIPAPAQLQATYPLTTNIGISFNLGDSGLFPQEELEKLQTIIQFPYQRQAIENSIASRIGGHSQNDGFQMSRIFSPHDVKQLTDNIWGHLTNWFWSVSHFYLMVFGIFTTYRVIRLLVVTILNALNLYQLEGCTTLICLSFCNAVPLWMLGRRMRRNDNLHPINPFLPPNENLPVNTPYETYPRRRPSRNPHPKYAEPD